MKLIYQMFANVFIVGNRTKQYIALLMCTSWLCEITQEIVIIWSRINPIYASRIERDTLEQHLRQFYITFNFLYRKYLGHDRVCFSNIKIEFKDKQSKLSNLLLQYITCQDIDSHYGKNGWRVHFDVSCRYGDSVLSCKCSNN